jgi:hypothetical protein
MEPNITYTFAKRITIKEKIDIPKYAIEYSIQRNLRNSQLTGRL